MTNETSDFAAQANKFGADYLPGLLGLNFTGVGDGWVEAEIEVRKALTAPNGFLHAGTVVSLADTACAFGCVRALPEGANGFTTVELKTNFLSSTLDGIVTCRAEAAHLGRMTQLWDATVKSEATGKVMAHFRCTQMVLWPKK